MRAPIYFNSCHVITITGGNNAICMNTIIDERPHNAFLYLLTCFTSFYFIHVTLLTFHIGFYLESAFTSYYYAFHIKIY